MYNHSNLIFFNKEGDGLNFQYNQENARFEGDILFHESSTDIYKTYGIYTLEKIPESQFDDTGLRLNKFQLFNEWGFHFYGEEYTYERVNSLEPTNNDSEFYSKWIYGDNFDKKFPIGSLICFITPFLEFDRKEKTYVVIGTKKDAFMILSSINNASFEDDYYSIYSDTVSYVSGIFVKGVNAIGIYNYIDSEYKNNISDWSEPEFYKKLYNGKKLNIINSKSNDGTYTISNSKLVDSINYEYSVTDLPENKDLVIEVISRNDLPIIYNGSIEISDQNIYFRGQYGVPKILKSNTEFKIIGSDLNSNFFTVVDLPDFLNYKTTYYEIQSQVIFNNKIYECIQAYTHSFIGILQFSTPETANLYWSEPTHIKVKEGTYYEKLGNAQLYLTTNINTFYHGWIQSKKVTLSSAAIKYNEELRLLGIDLYYDRNLKADLIYSSKYAEVNFYHTSVDKTNLITNIFKTNERLIGVEEKLNNELNYNISSNLKCNIVFINIDNYGLKIRVNNQFYEGEVIWVYSNSVVDMERTLDRTLRGWITKNYIILYTLGIISELSYTGNYNSPYYNTIVFRTYYPNVPFDIKEIKVGTNVKYFIRHSSILLQDNKLLGPNFIININNKNFSTITQYLTYTSTDNVKIADVITTLKNWVTENYQNLYDNNIIVSSIGNLLNFDLLSVDKNLNYNLILDTGKTQIPGDEGYKIVNYFTGNEGCLISSNEINLTETSTKSFENGDFATGMVVGINSTNYTYNNQEYNIQFLDPKKIGLSYKGPFWAIEDSICNSSAFVTLAFDIGFGATACIDTNLLNGTSFNSNQFSTVNFSITNSENTYSHNEIDISSYYSSNSVDIKYIQLSNSIYIFGKNLIILDAYTLKYKETITLDSIDSIKLEFNPTNGYLYCLSKLVLYTIDVTNNTLVTTMFFSETNIISQSLNIKVSQVLSGIWEILNITLSGDFTNKIDQSSIIEFTYLDNTNKKIKISTGISSISYNSGTNVTTINPLFNGPIPLTKSTNHGSQTLKLSDKYATDINFDKVGNIYVSFSNWNYIKVYNNTKPLKDIQISLTGGLGNKLMVFNAVENNIYISTKTYIDNNGDSTSDIHIINTSTISKSTTIFTVSDDVTQLIYEPVNDSIYAIAKYLYKIKSTITTITSIEKNNFTSLLFNNLTNEINISNSNGKFYSLGLNDNIEVVKDTVNYGYTTLNQFDSFIYITSEIMNVITVIDPITGKIQHKQSIDGIAKKVIYNPIRKSIISLIPSTNKLSEITTYLNSKIEYSVKSWENIEAKYGSLDKFYLEKKSLWLNTREYLRRPRDNYNGDVKINYYWIWDDDDVPEFFLYDASGEQLTATGSYEYTGIKPLGDTPLSPYTNTLLDKVESPEYQQTVFNYIEYDLEYIDSEDDIKTNPKPLELFIGFKGNEEGTYKNVLKLYKNEPVTLEIQGTVNNIVTFDESFSDELGPHFTISINDSSSINFRNKGLKAGQIISLTIKDTTNKVNQYLSPNNSLTFQILNIYTKVLVLDIVDTPLKKESTEVLNYPKLGNKTYLNLKIEVLDIEIGSFNVYGQTEIEDIRFKTELNNIGKNIEPYDIFIFKEYDIYEGGIDWGFLNKKRKELLLTKNQIFPYIGSYKSIINSINFFGYNDLKLSEYYRNIDSKSSDFYKLFKVEIPDIFDNTIEGWTENDFIKNTLPNNNFEETNMFNLSYPVTDREGNNILNYEIDEITIKLQGLKYWLKKNIIPLSHKILDITGQSYLNSETNVTHTMIDAQIINLNESMSPISFKLNESYLMPVNSGSTVYTCVIDFYSILSGVGAEKDESIKIHNDYKNELSSPDYFNIKIRTYKTYKEWLPFKTYTKGDKVIYYGQIYESMDNNKINNPKEFDQYVEWSPIQYSVSDIVMYKDYYYSYTGIGGEDFSLTPYEDPKNWKNITNWKKINYEPVQTINEYRSGDNLNPFNFTIDANIDPFVVIEVTSDNGYGAIYRDKKNYEIRTLNDLYTGIQYIESIGPFQPITILE